MLHRLTGTCLSLFAVLAWAAPSPSAVREAGDAVRVTTSTRADSVTVGQRFDVEYRAVHADTLRPVTPATIRGGTCRVIGATWSDTRGEDRMERTGRVTFMAVSLDSVYVPAQALDFVAPGGDTLRAWTDPVRPDIRYLSAQSQDLRPLKAPWEPGPNWLFWIALAAGALALAGALVWWIRRRRARVAEPAAEVRIPPDLAALTELERIEAMGLVARGEFKTFYTLVVDVVRRYLEARFGVEALDRTTREILEDLERRGRRVDGLEPLLNESDLVKFAKFEPRPETATAAIEAARAIVVTTTPRDVTTGAAQAGGVAA